jgi:hypothetical protein
MTLSAIVLFRQFDLRKRFSTDNRLMALPTQIIGWSRNRVVFLLPRSYFKLVILMLETLHTSEKARGMRTSKLMALSALIHPGWFYRSFTMTLEADTMSGFGGHLTRSCRHRFDFSMTICTTLSLSGPQLGLEGADLLYRRTRTS